jgi:hypothetical protein
MNLTMNPLTRLDLGRYFPFWRRPASEASRTVEMLAHAAASDAAREDVWCDIVRRTQARHVLELGVWRGAFAAQLLRRCPDVARYYMLDPWRRLDDWNKPANVDQAAFDDIHAEAMRITDFAGDRRVVLRGKTTEVIDQIPDRTLDLAYVDADHTLRGISIDLIRTYPKIRPGGVLGGDDYSRTIWQHPENFEPSLVCPFAAYFAESQGAPLVVLRHGQFAIVKPDRPGNHFQVIDTTGAYGERTLLWQIAKRP